ncbi:MAG: GAF domain-containing protein, partial [Burkholderiales bacterium]|nr:GAF domain-containing protein [Burkholderiales bacterium]
MLAFAVVAGFVSSARISADLERRADHALQLAAISLPLALRKGDILVVDDIAKAIMADDAIVHLTVREQNIVIFRETHKKYENKDYAYFNTSPQFIVKQKQLYFSDIATKNQHVGSITLIVSRASVRNEVIANIVGIVGLTLTVIVVIALTSLFITRRYISRPLSKLQYSAALIAAGDLRVPVETDSEDEIGHLARDLDAMRGAIKDATENLEQKVELRTRDLSEALEQQTAISDVLKVMSRSTSDLQPVLETLIENATKLCRADHGIIFRSDGKVFRLAAAYGSASPEWLDFVGKHPISPGRGTIVGRVALERQIIHVPDVLVDPEYKWTQSQKLGGFRTVLGVPLLRKDIPIGIIFMAKETVQPFTGKQVELIATFADQALIAIENVRLFQELETRNKEVTESLQQQTATAEILRVISSSPTDIQPVLDAVAESAARLCEAVDTVIWLVDGDILRSGAHYGPIAAPEEWTIPIARGSGAGRAVADRKTIHVLDMAAETEEYPEGSAYASRYGFHTMLSTPLLREGVPIGAILIRRDKVRAFSENHIALLQTFADQAVIAIENVRLFQELEARNTDITESLEQQTATSEVLRVISSSPSDLQPVFDMIAKSSRQLCHGNFTGVFKFDGELI